MMATNQSGTDGAGGELPVGFELDIRVHGLELTDAIRQYAIDHIATKLATHAHRVQAVIIRLADTNGMKGGEDKLCRVEVLIPGENQLVVEEINQDLRAAMDLASDRIEQVVRRTLERRRALPRQQGHKLVRSRKAPH